MHRTVDPGPSESSAKLTSESLFRNFAKFSICFSVIHASVNSALAYSSTLLGPGLGSYGSAVLYVAYSLSTILLSGFALKLLGPKWTVIAGLCALEIYVLSFFVALLCPMIQWPVFIVGAAFGGVGAGVVWVGQSTYYTCNAAAHSDMVASRDAPSSAYAFAAVFAFAYLSLEVLLQILALSVSLARISDSTWRIIVFGTSSTLAIIASVIMTSLYDFQQAVCLDETNRSFESYISDLKKTSQLILSSNRMMLIMPFQICFGLSSGLINYYINSFVVADRYGDGYVGLVMAIDTLSSALAVYPVAHASRIFGAYSVIFIGIFIYFINGLMVLSLSNSVLAQWQYLLPLFLSHGASRCIWEGVNKALVAENFANVQEREAAFTAVYFCSGLSAGVSFFSYYHMNKFFIALVNIIWALLAGVSFFAFAAMVPPLSDDVGDDLIPILFGSSSTTSTPTTNDPLILPSSGKEEERHY